MNSPDDATGAPVTGRNATPVATARVAVVIIAFNGARFIRRALDSLQAQTFRDFELLVVEDGSHDGTEAIVAGYEDPRFRYIWRPNGGLSAARNTGIEHSTAPLIAFLDCDDWWHPEKLASQVAMLDAHPESGVAYSMAIRVDETTGAMEGPIRTNVEGDLLPRLLLNNQVVNGPSSLMVRRSVMVKAGLFDEQVRYAEDWDCWLRLATLTRFRQIQAGHVFALVRADSHSRRTAEVRDASFALLTRAFEGPAAQYRHLRRRAFAGVEFTSCIDYSERGLRWHATASALRALRWRPFTSRYWRRLVLLLAHRV